jgi:hypothetical protein
MEKKEIIIPLFEWNLLLCKNKESKSKLEWLRSKVEGGYIISIENSSCKKEITDTILSIST